MKNTICALSLAALSLSSLKADPIENAIIGGKSGEIKVYVDANITFDRELIDKYTRLAEAKVAQKEAAAKNLLPWSLSKIEMLVLCGEIGLTLFTFKKIYEEWHKTTNKRDEKGKKVIVDDKTVKVADWKSWTTVSICLFTNLMYGGGTLKKLFQTNNKSVALEKAKKVLESVKQLEVHNVIAS